MDKPTSIDEIWKWSQTIGGLNLSAHMAEELREKLHTLVEQARGEEREAIKALIKSHSGYEAPLSYEQILKCLVMDIEDGMQHEARTISSDEATH